MTDRISVKGVRIEGIHGVYESERQRPQPFVVDVELDVDLSVAGETDGLQHTVNYADVVGHIQRIITWEPVSLIETLAERIAASCLTLEHVEAVQVTVHKPQAPLPAPFSDVAVTIRRERWRPAVIALGANMGEVERTLSMAVRRIAECAGVRVRTVSRLYHTDPIVDPESAPAGMENAPHPEYLNAVVLCDTRLAAGTLLRAMQQIELEFGRTRTIKWGPRTLDLDLIQVGDPREGTDVQSHTAELTLPHPHAHERAFVLVPWVDADPQAHLRVEGEAVSVAELAARAVSQADHQAAYGNVLVGHEAAGAEALASVGVRPGPEWNPTW